MAKASAKCISTQPTLQNSHCQIILGRIARLPPRFADTIGRNNSRITFNTVQSGDRRQTRGHCRFPAFWILLVIGYAEEPISKNSLRMPKLLISQRITLSRLSDAISEPMSDASTTSRLDWKGQLLCNTANLRNVTTTEALEILVEAPSIVNHSYRNQQKKHQNLPAPIIGNSLAKSVWHRCRGHKNSTGSPNS
jgi:hypothetical protein